MKFFEFFVHRRVLTSVIVIIAIILGSLSYWRLQLRRFPDVEFPIVTVTTIYSGGSPAEIESEITQRIEDAVSSLSGIDEVSSYSQQGLSQVIIQFELDQDVDVKALDVLNEVDSVEGNFPEAAEDPVMSKLEVGQEPVVTLALRGGANTNELYRIAEEDLSERISQLTGVASVNITGGQEREIEVLLDNAKLRQYNVSINQVAQALRNTNRDIPAGYITEKEQESLVRTKTQFRNIDEIRKVRVPTPGADTINVGRLAKVVDGHEDQRTASRVDGKSAVVLTVQKQSSANDVMVAEAVREALPDLEKRLPAGAGLEIVQDESEFVVGALTNVQKNMLIGIVLTAVALFLFLNSGRSTAIAATVIPTSLITALLFMMFGGFSLNILTLTALALAVGIVVNISILILENSVAMMERGNEREEAASLGATDIARPVLSTAATNLVVFLPIAFMGEMIGRMFREFGLTIVFVTIASLGISFTLTPMMCGALLRHTHGKGGLLGVGPRMWQWLFEHLKRWYLKLLRTSLKHPKKGLGVWVCLLIIVIGGLGPTIGKEFMPESDEGKFRIAVQTPAGTPLDVTREAVRRAEEAVAELPYLEHYYSRVGRISGTMGGSNRGVNLGEVSVTLRDKSERPVSLKKILDRVRPKLAEIPSAKVTVKRSGGGPGQDPVQVEVRGNNLEELRQVAYEVKDVVENTPGTGSINKSWQSGQPELRVFPSEEKLERYKLTASQVGRAVRGYIDGAIVGEFREKDERYDIRLRLREEDRRNAEALKKLFVQSPTNGEMLRLERVAGIQYAAAPTLITRKDRMRYMSINAQLAGQRPLSEVMAGIREKINTQIDLPKGVEISYGGTTEMMRDNFKELFKALGTAAVLTFFCVAGIIESFVFAGLIIFSLPLSLLGVIAVMVVAGVNINIFSLMAMIMLVGMVVNNSIIIIDYATRKERSHWSPVEQVTAACDARYRMILMANSTTIAAMIPLSLGLGFAGEIFRPIAVVQIGGLLAATVLSLLVMPLLYVLVRRQASEEPDESSPS